EDRQRPAARLEHDRPRCEFVAGVEDQRAEVDAEPRGAAGREQADERPAPLPLAHQPPPPEQQAQAEERPRLLDPDHGRNESARVAARPSPTSLTNASVSVPASGTARTTSCSSPCATSRPPWMMPTWAQSPSTTSSTCAVRK